MANVVLLFMERLGSSISSICFRSGKISDIPYVCNAFHLHMIKISSFDMDLSCKDYWHFQPELSGIPPR